MRTMAFRRRQEWRLIHRRLRELRAWWGSKFTLQPHRLHTHKEILAGQKELWSGRPMSGCTANSTNKAMGRRIERRWAKVAMFRHPS